MKAVPLERPAACEFVDKLHRHHQGVKQDKFRIVELMGDLPRIELFARSAAEGWDCWGNEAPGMNENDGENAETTKTEV